MIIKYSVFFQAHIQSGIDYASTLWDSASDSLKKPLKSLHRRAIKIVLKRTSLTDKDYKAAQILPRSSRLMSNKGRFVHKIVSGRAPLYKYLSTKLLINQSSRNSSRKLNDCANTKDRFIQVQPGLFWSCSLEPIAQRIEASSQSFSV